MLITAVAGNTLTVQRAFAGTAARTHASGKLISGLIDAAHQQALKSAIINIETALGANPSGVGMISSAAYKYPAQTPGTALISGGLGQTIPVNPCPAGIGGSSVYVAGG